MKEIKVTYWQKVVERLRDAVRCISSAPLSKPALDIADMLSIAADTIEKLASDKEACRQVAAARKEQIDQAEARIQELEEALEYIAAADSWLSPIARDALKGEEDARTTYTFSDAAMGSIAPPGEFCPRCGANLKAYLERHEIGCPNNPSPAAQEGEYERNVLSPSEPSPPDWQGVVERLRHIAELEKALDWYADPKNWERDAVLGEFDSSLAMNDFGNRARAALKDKKP